MLPHDYGAITVKDIPRLVTSERVAVILVFPGAIPVAKPAAEMVATVRLELAQVT